MIPKTFRLILVFCLVLGAAAAQPVMGGLKIGAPLTDAFDIATVPSPFMALTANANGYTLGPFIEVRLPLNLSIEGDALYRGYNFSITTGSTVASTHSSSWDFPIVAKYHFFKGPVKPYVEGGLDFSHLGSFKTMPDITQALAPNHNSNFGVVLGAGVQLNLLILRISPEIRYTGDTLKNFTGVLDSNRNQLAFLVGIGF
jgi:opacity protein-like surface antigen